MAGVSAFKKISEFKTQDLSKKHIMIVEDHDSNILVTTLLLKESGCTYDVAMNGVQAVDLFKYKKYDAILMDVQMPQMSGLEATQVIRKMEETMGVRRTPIIALSAHVQPADKAGAMASGMDDFLAKPFDSQDLRSRLERLV